MKSFCFAIALFTTSSAHAYDTTLNDSDLRELSAKLAKEISLCAENAKSLEIKSVKNKTADFIDKEIIIHDFDDEFQKISRKKLAKARKKMGINIELTSITKEDAQGKSSVYKMTGKLEGGACQGAVEVAKTAAKDQPKDQKTN